MRHVSVWRDGPLRGEQTVWKTLVDLWRHRLYGVSFRIAVVVNVVAWSSCLLDALTRVQLGDKLFMYLLASGAVSSIALIRIRSMVLFERALGRLTELAYAQGRDDALWEELHGMGG